MAAAPTTVAGRARVLGGVAAFGAFWGTWGAALPAVQGDAGVSDGELGVALLCIGAGARACMRGAGSLIDRFGAPALPAALACFPAAALLPGLARSAPALGAALLVARRRLGRGRRRHQRRGDPQRGRRRPAAAQPCPRDVLGVGGGREPRVRPDAEATKLPASLAAVAAVALALAALAVRATA
jgi:hypothetical protein